MADQGGGMASFIAALACLVVAYALFPRLPKGVPRLLLLLLFIPFLAFVPFATRPHHLRAILSFSFLWICPSKLLLRCWDLSPDYPGRGFLYFAITMLLPIRVQAMKPIEESPPGRKPSFAHTKQGAHLPLLLHFLAFVALLNVYHYRERLSLPVILALYCLQVYLGLEWVLGLQAKLASMLLGVQTYPQFDNPLMSSSLSEFWGKRWNLVATSMIRETVYVPVLYSLSGERWHHTVTLRSDTDVLKKGSLHADIPGPGNVTLTSRKVKPSAKTVNKKATPSPVSEKEASEHRFMDKRIGEFRITKKPPLFARLIAMLTSFVISGLIHELIFCCITQSYVTWEVTMFFILQGFATAMEVYLRRNCFLQWKLPHPVAVIITLAFLYITAALLFMPPIVRSGSDVRIIAEFYELQSALLNVFRRD